MRITIVGTSTNITAVIIWLFLGNLSACCTTSRCCYWSGYDIWRASWRVLRKCWLKIILSWRFQA